MNLAAMTGKSARPDVAIIHRYFWPQNYPYAVMLRYIAEGIAERGLTVAVYSSHEPNSEQKERRQQWSAKTGITVRSLPLWSERSFKLWKKAAQALIYVCWVFIVALRCRASVIWVGTTPPLLMVSVLRFARFFRRFKIVYHCQDIHPEALAINGNISKGKILSFLKKLDSGNVCAADVVVTLSEDMKKTLSARPCNTNNVHIINNFILDDIPEEKRAVVENPTPHLLFSGSLGRFQNLCFLTEVVIKLASDYGVRTTFMGDGPMRPEMERKVRSAGLESHILFTGHRPLEEAIDAMQSSDYGLVSLSEGVDRVAYPSKTLMYLAAGLPCIAFVDPLSSLGKMIQDEQLGFAVLPVDVESVVNKLGVYLNSRNLDVISKSEISEFARTHFSCDVVVKKMADLVAEIVK